MPTFYRSWSSYTVGAGAAYRSWNPRQELEAGSDYSSLPEQAGQKREPTDGGGGGGRSATKITPPLPLPHLELETFGQWDSMWK